VTATLDLTGEAARMHSAAKQVAQMFHVFPVDNPIVPYCDGVGKGHDSRKCTERGKHPACKWSEWGTQDPDKVDRYFGGNRPHNIGIDCGKSGILVVDEDTEGEWDRLCRDQGVDPPTTFTVRTARGRHIYFRQPDGTHLGNKEGAIRGYKINVRGTGGFVVGPGSLHATGVIYKIAKPLADAIPVPDWLIKALKAKLTSNGQHGETGSSDDDRAWWREGPIPYGNHHNAIVAAAGWCRTMGHTIDEAKPYVRDVLSRCVDSAYTEEEAFTELDDVYGRYDAGHRLEDRRVAAAIAGADNGVMTTCLDCGESIPLRDLAAHDEQVHGRTEGALPDGYRATDVGNAARLLAIANGKIRHVHAWGKWLVYQDGRWIIDENDVLVTEDAKGVARLLFKMAATINGNKDLRERVWNWALRSETSGAISAMVRLARGAPGILVEHEQLDADPHLLNVHNGTIDLRAGTLRPHDPADLITIQCPVDYDPNAKAPLWEACVERWQPDPTVRDYVQVGPEPAPPASPPRRSTSTTDPAATASPSSGARSNTHSATTPSSPTRAC
jgi:hypothetical protein